MTLVFAGLEDDALSATLATRLRDAGLAVSWVGLRPAADDAACEARLRSAVHEMDMRSPLIVAGFSKGGRIAARLCSELSPEGLLCFGFPFHARGNPQDRHGLRALAAVEAPVRIIQGTRDNHGGEAAVRGYALPDGVDVVWLQDGNHRFRPRAGSGYTETQHVEAAVAAGVCFVRRLGQTKPRPE